MSYILRSGTVNVPKGMGLDGYLHAIKQILVSLPRLQSMSMNSKGSITYTWYAPEDNADMPVAVDFEDVQPYSIVRNSNVVDIECADSDSTLERLHKLFSRSAAAQLFPVGVLTGANPLLPKLLDKIFHHEVLPDTLFGVPLYLDRNIPDDVLILCCSYSRIATLVDTYMCFKTHLVEEVHDERSV